MHIFQFNTIKQLINTLSTEKDCHEFIAQHRWNTGIINCPNCNKEHIYVFKDGIRYKCKNCKRIFTAVTGTAMHGTKLPLADWILAIWLLLNKKGISSVELSRQLGITQKSAWYLLQKIRIMMTNEKQEMLEGIVEIDEAFVGGKSRFKHKAKKVRKYTPGRNWYDKTPILGMLQRGGKVRALIVPNVQMLTLKKTAYTHIKPGSTIMGDGFQGYRALMAYDVYCVDHGRGWYVDGEIHTNTIEGFWSQFKKGICSTYHKTTPKHLNKYLQEFVFKYNHRKLDKRQQLERILWQMNIHRTNRQLRTAA